MDFVLANSADLDEMPPHVAFHLGLHCLPKYSFRGFPPISGGFRLQRVKQTLDVKIMLFSYPSV